MSISFLKKKNLHQVKVGLNVFNHGFEEIKVAVQFLTGQIVVAVIETV